MWGPLGRSWFSRSIFHRGIQELKKVEGVSESPWVSHVASCMQGLVTIHAKRDDRVSK